jgi:hypothetical protein
MQFPFSFKRLAGSCTCPSQINRVILIAHRPVLVFVIIAILSASASLFLVEAMSHIRGNERFQAQVEFTTIAELCLGRRLHFVLQGILYIALQSVNISSIIISCQVSAASVHLLGFAYGM